MWENMFLYKHMIKILYFQRDQCQIIIYAAMCNDTDTDIIPKDDNNMVFTLRNGI